MELSEPKVLTAVRGLPKMRRVGLSAKSFDDPDERIALPGSIEDVVEIGGFQVVREEVAPGWRWSKDAKPVVGGEWCDMVHDGITLSGRWGVVLPNGSTIELGPGDVFHVPAGHDSWTIGDEPCVTLNWSAVPDAPRT